MAIPRICSVDGCDKQPKTRGLCAQHYRRFLKNCDPRIKNRCGRPKMPPRPCSVDGCSQNVKAKGLCQKHYLRLWKTGSLTTNYAAPGAGLQWIKENVNHAGEDCLIWPYGRKSKRAEAGYGIVYFDGRATHASRVMCIFAHGDPPGPAYEAAHSCGHGHLGCVNPRHLRWATPLENSQDKRMHGTYVRGEKVNGAKLTEGDVRQIRSLAGVFTSSQIAADFGLHRSYVDQILRRARWAWLE